MGEKSRLRQALSKWADSGEAHQRDLRESLATGEAVAIADAPEREQVVVNGVLRTVTLRPRGGRTQVTDGPYTEAKEMVGGLFIIEADSQEEALRIASMHPAATLGEEGGWAVELIPMDFYLGR